MLWSKVFGKGVKGLGSVVIGFLVAQIPMISELAAGLIPEKYAVMTVAGLVAFLINAGLNWLKHRLD